MKDTEKRAEFIELRAQGYSYGKIAEQLHIAKSTAKAWADDYEAEIAERQGERLQDLYSLYGMSKEARVARIGGTLEKINAALAEKDLSELPADKLLQMKLQYERALREEYTDPAPQPLGEYGEQELLAATAAIFRNAQSGTLTASAAKVQLEGQRDVAQAKRLLDAANDPFNNFWG